MARAKPDCVGAKGSCLVKIFSPSASLQLNFGNRYHKKTVLQTVQLFVNLLEECKLWAGKHCCFMSPMMTFPVKSLTSTSMVFVLKMPVQTKTMSLQMSIQHTFMKIFCNLSHMLTYFHFNLCRGKECYKNHFFFCCLNPVQHHQASGGCQMEP